MATPDHDKQSQATLELDELALREQEIEELILTDPLAAEEMIRNGELDDEDTSTTSQAAEESF